MEALLCQTSDREDRLNPGMVSEVKIIEEKRLNHEVARNDAVVLATAFAVGRVTINAVTFGSVAGTSYAYGRKVGRVICTTLDNFEEGY